MVNWIIFFELFFSKQELEIDPEIRKQQEIETTEKVG